MKQFLAYQRNSILGQAVYSSATISVSIYIIVRTFSYDFPMSWGEELLLFTRIIFNGTILMVLTTVGCAGIYKSFVRMKRRKKTA